MATNAKSDRPGRRTRYVVLLRGINVGGKNRLPMAELRATCERIDCEDVHTYIQSGNLVLTSTLSAAALSGRLERAIEQAFGIDVPVIVRNASSWNRYVEGNPFMAEAADEADRVLLCLSARPPGKTAASDLQQRATQGERVVNKGDAIWIHYANGIGRSKLSPAVLDRHVGSSVTARNWRTVLKLAELVGLAAAQSHRSAVLAKGE